MSSDGALILVVGPSGAGKDSILREARKALHDDERIRFARRFITRAPDANEDNCALTTAQFATARALGGFLLSWDAHGLSYGLPASVAIDLARGMSVVANVSRAIVEPARRMWARTFVIQISASPDVLAARLAARGRDTNADERLSRSKSFSEIAADLEIVNDGELEMGARQMTAFISATCAPALSAAAPAG